MPELLLGTVAPASIACLFCSFLLELLLHPRPWSVLRRPLPALLLHSGLVTLLFALELLLFRRPWFAAANVQALLLFVILVSNAKFQALKEPFIYPDFEYFSDALKHPRLYLPFLGLGRTIMALVVLLGALLSGVLLETALVWDTVVPALGILIAIGGTVVWLASGGCPAVSCRPLEDVSRLGLLASLWCYGREELTNRPVELPFSSMFQAPAGRKTGQNLPDLVVVQSESFFDPRRFFAGIHPDILEPFDRLKASSVVHGTLKVPAWGANTVRSEYAFLSGLDAGQLGIHQFNPYRWIARQGVPTIAGYLKRLGYRTLCIHPYPASFYCRDILYPLMGFDEFIDLQGFRGMATSGPYIGDTAVAVKVDEILEENRARANSAPLFIFVITMENHGPLHLERVRAGEIEELYAAAPPEGCDDLTIYLRHLVNAARMSGMIRESLEKSEREGWLCFFGDHLPIMARVYQTLGYPDGDSDYLLWSNRGCKGTAQALDMKVEDLAELIFKHAGLAE